jgi:hypothetical protein
VGGLPVRIAAALSYMVWMVLVVNRCKEKGLPVLGHYADEVSA